MYAASGAAILHVCTILGLGWQVFCRRLVQGIVRRAAVVGR